MDRTTLEDFFGKEVILLLNARAVLCPKAGGESLEAVAKLSKEDQQHGVGHNVLRVDYISYTLDHVQPIKKYGAGFIDLTYVIGVFEQKEDPK